MVVNIRGPHDSTVHLHTWMLIALARLHLQMKWMLLWLYIVRATGLLCLLGITVGLGSVFIYRLYTKLFSAADDKHRRRVSDLCSSVRSTTGIGNLPSTLDVSTAFSVQFNLLMGTGTLVPNWTIWSWYTGRWWVGCYIWYSDEGDWVGPQPAQAPHRCTKCNSPPINDQCTNHCIAV